MAKTKEKHDILSIAGLNLSPNLVLSEHFEKTPPDFTIYNNGPVEAIYLDVEQILHFYENGKFGVSIGQGENKYATPKLSPQTKISIVYDKTLLDNARKVTPIENSVLEVRLVYRRPSDKKPSRVSAFFFINPHGEWVPELDGSLVPSVYGPLKRALAESIGSLAEFRYPFGVPLHSIELKE
jgi:hypothetical protein